MHRPPPCSTLFPYTTLFRSLLVERAGGEGALRRRRAGRHSGLRRGLRRGAVDGGGGDTPRRAGARSEEHTSELQSHSDLVCRLLLEKKKKRQEQKNTARNSD